MPGNQEAYPSSHTQHAQTYRTGAIEVIEIQHEEWKGWKDQRIFHPDRSEFHLEDSKRILVRIISIKCQRKSISYITTALPITPVKKTAQAGQSILGRRHCRDDSLKEIGQIAPTHTGSRRINACC
jgi:hypothetical protein